MCGRCGGRLMYVGYIGTIDYFECYRCGDVTGKYDPEFNYRINVGLHQNPARLILKASAKAQFVSGGVKKLKWQTRRK